MSVVVGLDGKEIEIPPPAPEPEAELTTEQPVAPFEPDAGLVRLLELMLADVKAGDITAIFIAAVGPQGTYDAAAPMALPFEDLQRLICQVDAASLAHKLHMRNSAIRIYTTTRE